MKRDQRGFTLIELMVAVVIMAIGLLSLAGLQGTAIQGNRQGNMISQATVLAEDRIETIRNTDYDLVNDTTFPSAIENFDNVFDRTTLIETDVPLVGLKRITVTVQWNDIREHRIELRTIVSDEG